MYGRYPFLENGLIFLCGLLFYLYVRFHEHDWMLILAGLITALAVVSGKMFGIVMLVPVLLPIVFGKRNNTVKRIALFAGSFIGFAIIASLVYYGGNIGLVYNYVSEQTVGMYGVPEAALSPLAFLRKAVSFGGDSRLFYFAPFFMLLLIVSLILLISRKNTLDYLKGNMPLLFNLGWLLAGFIVLMAVNYRPLRYQLFLLMPAAGIISIMMSGAGDSPVGRNGGIIKNILLFFVVWYGAGQIGYVISYLNDYGTASSDTVWYALIPAVPLSLALIFFKKLIILLHRRRNQLLIILGRQQGARCR